MKNINTPKYWEDMCLKEYEMIGTDEAGCPRWNYERMAYMATPIRIGKILDVGCAIGQLARYIKAMYADKVIVHGIERSKKVADLCTRISFDGMEFKSWDGKTIPYDNHSFDSVTCSEVIEHLNPNKLESFLKELVRVTKKDGNIIISTPNKSTSFFLGEPGEYYSREHVKEYTPYELRDIFKKICKNWSYAFGYPPTKYYKERNECYPSHYFTMIIYPYQVTEIQRKKLLS